MASKRLSYRINNEFINLGIDEQEEQEALKELDYWRTIQADNYIEKSASLVKKCHKQIEKILEYIKRNTY